MFQSLPLSKTVIVNGDALCTCGCGHTVAICSENHGTEHTSCKCNHDKQEETNIVILSFKIDKFIFGEAASFIRHKESLNLFAKIITIYDQFKIDIILPPPKLV